MLCSNCTPVLQVVREGQKVKQVHFSPNSTPSSMYRVLVPLLVVVFQTPIVDLRYQGRPLSRIHEKSSLHYWNFAMWHYCATLISFWGPKAHSAIL